MMPPEPHPRAAFTERRILEVLFDQARAERMPDGSWRSLGLSYGEIAVLLDVATKTVKRTLTGTSGLIAQGRIRAEPLMDGSRRVGTAYYAPPDAVLPGTPDHRAVLKGVLGNLRAQLAALDTARELTLASVASVQRLLKGRTDGESSSSAGG